MELFFEKDHKDASEGDYQSTEKTWKKKIISTKF